ncbi:MULTISPECIES: hypothetical protein [unclassified Clostridioides]|uniref:hypothetical protein n=1 Tax=unclassified Clostridioides TaxID=2635829 RepID=UPI001D11B9DA|nr:hypothetical protein [Clostridioides sp. ZZV14-6150]MCC0659632.1 hypothetical protein [Clostridioides sp. ZZV14-6154]MCC0719359.1 hypothetical protein [Clostridioides sp. ZZV14-6105]MCC0722974.1 hypothetical protein [Clostridioides sp. ZZV14-6104]MCC0742628.1 hypothetical protein [Clostridioides sp. ZZV14-6044]MCC0749994.1 hypothetical protein [Clostridioides sp. ZZV13-5731]WLD27557.1 hypothetical protein CDIFMA2_14370 [Clostridioides difficile]
MGNVKEESINMYLTDNYTPKMKQIIAVTETFRRVTVSVSPSTNAMANNIKSSMASASNSISSVNSSIKKMKDSIKSVNSSIEKMTVSMNNTNSASKDFSEDLEIIGSSAEKARSKLVRLSQVANSKKGRNTHPNARSQNDNSEVKKAGGNKPTKIKTVQDIVQRVKTRTLDVPKKMVTDKLPGFKNKIFNSRLVMDVKGSNFVQNTLNILNKIKNSKWISAISVKDLAKNVLIGTLSKLKQFAGRVWSGAISIKDKASSVLGGIKDKISDITNGFSVGEAVKKGVDLVGKGQNQKAVLTNVVQRTTGIKDKVKAKSEANEYYDDIVKDVALKTPFDPSEVISMSTKAMMIGGGDTSKSKDITQAMVDVRALNMDTSSEQDVSAAFVSASKGNMDALNTLVGENYKTFDDALKGIKEKQNGLAGEMAGTIPGLLSSASTYIDMGLNNMIEPFDTILQGGLKKINSFLEKVPQSLGGFSQKVADVMNGRKIAENKQNPIETQTATALGHIPGAIGNTGQMLAQNIDFTALTNSLLPIVNLVNGLLDSINNKSPVAQGIISIFGTVVTTAFQLIGPVVEAVSPIITRIFTFLGEYAPQINNFIETLGVIWKTVWETLGPLLEAGWKIIEPILGAFFNILDKVCKIVKDICKWWQTMVNKMKNGSITGTVLNLVEKSKKNYKENPSAGTKAGDAAGVAFGLNYVPYNEYSARLHEGEMVLTKQEANQYRSGKNGGNISIAKLADTIVIREEADIEKVTSKLVASIQMAQLGGVL